MPPGSSPMQGTRLVESLKDLMSDQEPVLLSERPVMLRIELDLGGERSLFLFVGI